MSENPETWFHRFHPGAVTRPRLVCFPHAGGSASFYFPLSRALSASIEVLAVQYPGRQDRRAERPVEDLPELAGRIEAALAGTEPRPTAFFGHSMGALVAFELARRLGPGAAPQMLFASGRRAPSSARRTAVHLLDDDGVLAEVRKLSGTDARVLQDKELMRTVLPAIRADYRAAETYACPPDATVGCPITALTGDRDPHVTRAEAEGWARHTGAAFALRVLPGGHFFLTACQDQIVETVTRQLLTPA
ncbi:alpha/beta fold hydrolase [Actinoplanes sp. NPDC026619]|uniref:thioesterase II family protein n=1 Tax=Actinoplanes sp. NPDC026619 TaxID=3155798 RepID=UPI0033F66569